MLQCSDLASGKGIDILFKELFKDEILIPEKGHRRVLFSFPFIYIYEQTKVQS